VRLIIGASEEEDAVDEVEGKGKVVGVEAIGACAGAVIGDATVLATVAGLSVVATVGAGMLGIGGE
jgi:hypothetical protein